MTLRYIGDISGWEIMSNLDPDRSSGKVFASEGFFKKYLSTLSKVRDKIPDITLLDIPDETKVLVYGYCVLLLDNEPLYSMEYCGRKEILALRVISELSIYTWGKGVLELTTGEHHEYIRSNDKFGCIHEDDGSIKVTHTRLPNTKLQEFNSNNFDSLEKFFETFMEYMNDTCWIADYRTQPEHDCYKININIFDGMWDPRKRSVVGKINGEFVTYVDNE